MTRLLSSLLLACSLLRADFVSKDWQFRRPVAITGWHAVSFFVLDESVYRNSLAGLRDLRIVRSGVECPYAIQALTGGRTENDVPAQMQDKAVVRGVGLQVLLDLNGRAPHNRIRIATAKRNFKQQVRIETSDDRKSWALVKPDGLIFDIFQADRRASDLTVEYPLSTRRYLRLTIPGWDDPADLASVWLTNFEETQPVREVRASFEPVAERSADTHETTFIFDKKRPGLPCDNLQLSVGRELFSRSANIWTSDDAKQWTFATEAQVSQTQDAQHLSVDFPEQWGRYLKLVISNGDSLPLSVERVTLSGVRRLLKFSSKNAGAYLLYSGNVSAREPSYDLAEITQWAGNAAAASLGQAERNSEYQIPGRPWTELHPRLLETILFLGVFTMGFAIVKFLLKTKLMRET